MDNEEIVIKKIKPFSKRYIIRTTINYMRQQVDVSIGRTFERVAEFDADRVKSKEVFETLSELHQIRKHLNNLETSLFSIKENSNE